MRKVNRYHQELLDQATAYGLNLIFLREKYKLPFVIKLFKHLQKGTRKKLKLIDPIFPDKFLKPEFSRDAYIDRLEEAGIKLKKNIWIFCR